MKKICTLSCLLLALVLAPAAVFGAENETVDTAGETHVLTREAPAEVEAGEVEYFSHELFSKPFSRAEASCAGRCDATSCVCAGDPDCCDLGCEICWALIDA